MDYQESVSCKGHLNERVLTNLMNGTLKQIPNHNIYSYSLDFLEDLDLSKVLFVQASRQPQFDETLNFLTSRLNLQNIHLMVSKTYSTSPTTPSDATILHFRYDMLSGSDPELIKTVTSGNFTSIFISVNEPRWNGTSGHWEALTKYPNILSFYDELDTNQVRTIDVNGHVNTIEDYFLLREFNFGDDSLRIYIQMDDREIHPFYQWALESDAGGHVVEIGRFGGGGEYVHSCLGGQTKKLRTYLFH